VINDKKAVCLIDDEFAYREALKLLFRSRNIPFLAFADGAEFFAGHQQKPIGCILIDQRLGVPPARTGLDLLTEMREKGIFAPAILLTAHADVGVVVEAMRAGAFDVLEKPIEESELVKRVRAAFEECDDCQKVFAERHAVRPRFQTLTRRENQVLEYIVAGERLRLIADHLGISPKTLDIHRANIMRKIQSRTIADLVRMCLLCRTDDRGIMPSVERPKAPVLAVAAK
jgi:FixJ family two-component response regulator